MTSQIKTYQNFLPLKCLCSSIEMLALPPARRSSPWRAVNTIATLHNLDPTNPRLFHVLLLVARQPHPGPIQQETPFPIPLGGDPTISFSDSIGGDPTISFSDSIGGGSNKNFLFRFHWGGIQQEFPFPIPLGGDPTRISFSDPLGSQSNKNFLPDSSVSNSRKRRRSRIQRNSNTRSIAQKGKPCTYLFS